MKLCTDCKWSTDLGGTVGHPSHIWCCSREEVGSYIDPVDGQRVYVKCHEARKKLIAHGEQQFRPCGPEGKLWEPKK